ncbi:heparinase II/III-family protein [Phenylobacterium sp.]|jgi:hypothetical protein|uniref:heparinase II/III family protein n=1 Tax=Phenylobacterium sp. TaxID=1871053 RepID=UPI002F9328C1
MTPGIEPFRGGLATKVETFARLGLGNLARVAAYRGALKFPASGIRRLSGSLPHGEFLQAAQMPPVSAPASSAWTCDALLFSHLRAALPTATPDWHVNPLTGQRVPDSARPWWAIPDFDPAVGDIKGIWELSRFDWVLALAQRARQGDSAALERLNGWLADWIEKNPPYRGPNWKCGQEASIRVLHLAMGDVVLGPVRAPQPAMVQLVRLHLTRIFPTTSYAIGQDNNHGTSEAAALFVGGAWLGAGGGRWEAKGRAMLEERIGRLVQEDGSFSQYSVNYHRLLLDTLCMVEVWRRRLELPGFSSRFYQRAAAATEWLHRITSPLDGDAPNVGANDGAKLLRLGDEPYRDHRPTVQLAAALFCAARAYPAGTWDGAAEWLGVKLPDGRLDAPQSHAGTDGGFAVLRRPPDVALLRYPRFRFRPSQSDLLHLDFWLDGENLLRDAGTYSYNTDPEWLNYFAGVEAHNTVQFDRRDQMPRLGRFLFGAWPESEIVQPLVADDAMTAFGATYTDARGARHERRVELSTGRLRVSDTLSGFKHSAVLRWRLAPGDWILDGLSVSNGRVSLHVESDTPAKRVELTKGYESRRYLERTELPVLEVEVAQSGTLVSEMRWQG